VARQTPTKHNVAWLVVERTVLSYQGEQFRITRGAGSVFGRSQEEFDLGAFADSAGDELVIRLTPGCQTYFEARPHLQKSPFTECDLVATAIVAALSGHPDADADRAGTKLSAVWSHHLAIVGGDDPRWVANTYAPSETKRISYRVQQMAALGVEVTGC